MSLSPEFPIPVQELRAWVPHRSPMVWVDEVLRADASEGECRIRLRGDAAYRSPHGVRMSSVVEWIAQSYAYVTAAVAIRSGVDIQLRPKAMFLAAVRDAVLDLSSIEREARLQVCVKAGRAVGPISIVDGVVFTETGMRVGSAQLKLFAQ